MRDLYRYRSLIANLVRKDLKLKYRNSVLGVVWSLLNPLLTLAVYSFAFHFVLRIGMPDYPLFLMSGLLPWNCFAAAVLASTGSVLQNAHLLRKVHFPREVLPVATVLFWFAQLLLALLVFLPSLLAVSRHPVRWTLLLLPLLFLLHLAFAVGLALAVSALATWFRDVIHLTEVALMLIFWLTPIVYPVTAAPARLQLLLKASPPAAFAVAYQDLMFWGRVPEPLVLTSLLISTAVALTAGGALFRSLSPGFVERL